MKKLSVKKVHKIKNLRKKKRIKKQKENRKNFYNKSNSLKSNKDILNLEFTYSTALTTNVISK